MGIFHAGTPADAEPAPLAKTLVQAVEPILEVQDFVLCRSD